MDINKSEYEKALEYHRSGKKGKLGVAPTKPLLTRRDLSLAYSPGVAAPCLEIAKNSWDAYEYTAKGNLVAVISNGTAVLGLGNLGAVPSKPVMEGKAVLFKTFGDVDAIDLEIDETDPEAFIKIVKSLTPGFGGVNLEDIKAPECFIIEKRLKEICDIPIFHDDQHGTAIITAAGLINALKLTRGSIEKAKIVVNGAGAAAIACLDLLVAMGTDKKNIILCDTKGVIYKGRGAGMNEWKEKYAAETSLRTLEEAVAGSEVFLGLSVKGALSKEAVKTMKKNPIIFAMANPDPEITPEEVKSVREDAIIATGRSDYNNQINNVMGFPYIFRGALDVRASGINMEMKKAAAYALAELARTPVPEEVSKAYGDRKMSFGPEYIIPVPFDPRLITTVPLAVAKAAVETKVSRISNFDLKKYEEELSCRLNPTSGYMNSLLDRIKSEPQRIVFAEGEEEEVLKAAIAVRDEGYGIPVIVGRRKKIEPILASIAHEGINLNGIEVMNAAVNKNLDKYIEFLYSKLQRQGYLLRDCARMVKSDRNIFAACMVACGDADALVTGVTKSYFDNFGDLKKVIETKEGSRILSYSIMIAKEHNILISDVSVCELPTPRDLAEITVQTAKIAKNMGYAPRAALLSFSNFGNPPLTRAALVKEAVGILDSMGVDFEYDGEMSADVALNPNLRKIYPFCRLSGPANILIMPGLHSASISTDLLKELAGGVFIGPVLDGFEYSVQIAQMGASSNELLKIAAFAAMGAITGKKSKNRK